ncbi:protein trichome birefringence-like 35, partial [Nicotiana attenuata]
SFSQLAPPVFDGQNYQLWAVRMETYLEALDLWEAVEEDYDVLPLPNNPTMAQIKSHKEKKTRKSKAKATLFAGVSAIIFTRVMALKSAKEIWDYLKGEYTGDERIRGMKVLNLIREFELQKMKESETVKEYSDRLLGIVNKHCGKKGHPSFKCWKRPDAKCKICNQLGHEAVICKGKYQKHEADAQVANEEEEDHLFVATILSTKKSDFWLIDSGCTNHMTYDRNLFKEFTSIGNKKVRIGNGDYILAKGKGNVATPTNSVFSILYDVEDPFLNGVTFSSKKEPLLKSSHNENLTVPRNPQVLLDKSSTCHSTVKYSGRRAKWGSPVMRSTGRRELLETCNYTSGKWVFDNTSHPLYNESDCPYTSDQVACQKYGRPDLDYQYLRWQPHNCNLKRWNSTEMWEKLRGKRLMFVGDSLNRGQWLSMVCLMQYVIPAEKQFMTQEAHLTSFRADVKLQDYNVSIEFLWAPFLVESNSDEPMGHRLPEKILRPDSNLRHSSHWIHADILVFNSYHWWRKGSVKLL